MNKYAVALVDYNYGDLDLFTIKADNRLAAYYEAAEQIGIELPSGLTDEDTILSYFEDSEADIRILEV